MTEKAFPRDKFDSNREFVVSRAFLFNGRAYLIGAAFDKTGIAPRRLRLLYDQRYLRMADVVSSTLEPVTESLPQETAPSKGSIYKSRRRLAHA